MTDEKVRVSKMLAEKIKECGGEAYFVGGYVRDKIMGKNSDDIDIEVHGLYPDALRKILQENTGYSEVGKSFGIFILNDYSIDIALPRKDVQKGRGHRDIDVCVDPFIGTMEAARRRDFTINSVMENVLTGEIIDHFNGRSDIKDKLIRHVNDKTFADDPLRILRAAQFAARFGFKIAKDTVNLSKGTDLTALSKERVYEETKKALLKAEKPSLYFENLKSMGHIAPWFEKLILPQDKWHRTMINIDAGASLREETDNPLAFMLFCTCSQFKNEAEVYNFVSALTSEKSVKKYVTNLYIQTEKLHNGIMNKSVYETNKIFDNTIDKKGFLCAAHILFTENRDIVGFLKKRLFLYNKTEREGFLKGRDLIEAGFVESSHFTNILDNARDLRLQGYSKEETLNMIKAQIPD